MSEILSPDSGRDDGDYLSYKPGQRLKKARELRGLSLEQVTSELRLSQRIVAGMEADDYSALPEPAFVRGYMRRYAQLVKLSPDDIAARFDQAYAADMTTPEPTERARNPVQILGDLARPRARVRHLLAWASLAVILLMVIGFFWGREENLPIVAEPIAPESVLAAPPLVAPVEQPPSVELPVVAADVLPLPSAPVTLPAPVGAAVQPPVAGDRLTVALTAESWVSVTDARGQSLTSALHKAGETLELTGEAPFAVSIGNAAGASLSINGKPVDLRPHTRGAVASLSVPR